MNAPLAEFRTYAEMRGAFSSVRELRDIPYEVLDEIAGLQSGYSAKIMGPRQIKRMGLQSLDLLLGALGIKCILVDDPEALARVKGRFKSRDVPHLAAVQGGAIDVRLNRGFLRKIGTKGGKSRWGNLSPKKRTALAKRLNKIRWGKVKRKSKEQARRARQRKASHQARKPPNEIHAASRSLAALSPRKGTRLVQGSHD